MNVNEIAMTCEIVFHCVWSIAENVQRIFFCASQWKVDKKRLIADDGLIMSQLNSNLIIIYH